MINTVQWFIVNPVKIRLEIKKKEKKAVGERKFRAEQNFSKKNREGKGKEGAGEKHRGLLFERE